MNSANDNAAVGNGALRIEGETARVVLPDFGLESYRTLVSLKSRLPRIDVDGASITFPAADLARLGLDVRAALGGYDAPDADALFDDQRYVVDVALRRRRFAVFALTGWGKTAAQLAWARDAARRTARKALIIAPLRVLAQTIEEHTARFGPDSTPPVDVRAVGLRAWLDDDTAHPVGVVNVDVFRKAQDLRGLGAIALDESSILKNAAGVLRNNLCAAAHGVEYRSAWSATPAPNDLDELVSQALFIGAIRSHKEFFADFFTSDSKGGWELRAYAKEAFYSFLASWSIWIGNPATYGFAPRFDSIPAPVYRDVRVEATPAQAEAARAHRKVGSLFLDGIGVVKRGKLAQISRGFEYYEKGASRAIPSGKPAAVADAVCAHPGERAVVWVTFDEEGKILRRELESRGRVVALVDGSMSDDASAEAVRHIQAGTADVLIAKPRTFGYGLNLQAASVVVFSGVSDSFEQDFQAVRRCLRFGQKKPVQVYYVVTDYEMPMLNNVRRKRAAWEEQSVEMERAYLAALGEDLASYRGQRGDGAPRARALLTDKDTAALSAIHPWSLAS